MAVFQCVVFARLFGVVRGVVEVAFRHMGVMAGLFVVASLMVFRSRLMMFRCVFVVFRCFAVVLRCLRRHGILLVGSLGAPGFTG